MSTRTECASVHFSISGDYLTDVTRQMVLEGRWRTALDLLVNGLDGFTIDQAVSVLKGTAKLDGVNTVNLVEDDQEEILREQMDELFSGIFLHEGSLYEPVSYHRFSDYPGHWNIMPSYLKSNYGPNEHQLQFEFQDNHCTDPVFIRYEKSTKDVPFWHTLNSKPTLPEDFMYLDQTDFDSANYRYDAWSGARNDAVEPTAVFNLKQKEAAKSREAAQDAEDDAREARQQAEYDKLFAMISEEADADTEYGWAQVPFKDTVINVPKRALIALMLDRASVSLTGFHYEPKSYSGIRMINDNPIHSDVILGSGLDPYRVHGFGDQVDHEQAIMDYGYHLQSALTRWNFNVLTRGDKACNLVYGKVVTEDTLFLLKQENNDDSKFILVVKNAAPEWDIYLSKVSAVIVEQGSQLAHLAVVAREKAVPILRMADATHCFKSGAWLSINFNTGIIS